MEAMKPKTRRRVGVGDVGGWWRRRRSGGGGKLESGRRGGGRWKWMDGQEPTRVAVVRMKNKKMERGCGKGGRVVAMAIRGGQAGEWSA